MSTQHYVDGSGNYIGGFGDGATPPSGTLVATAPPTAFHTWDGSAWQPDTAGDLTRERETMVVSRFQAKAALSAAGHLPSVEVIIAAADATTQLAWNEAIEFKRNSPLIISLGAAMPLTETQIDDLFRAAAVISV